MKLWKQLLGGLLSAVMLTGALTAAPVTAFAAESEEIATGGVTGDCTWALNTKTGALSVKGSGRMADYSYQNPAPWKAAYDAGTEITAVYIEGGVTYVGENTFCDCRSLKTLTLAGTVEEIGSYAFEMCTALNKINFSNGLKRIGFMSFADTAITSLTLPKSVTKLDAWAFSNAHITSLTVPDECRAYLIDAFLGCQALTTVYLGKGVTGVDEGVFAMCPLTSVTVSEDNQFLAAKYNCLYSKDLKKLYAFRNGDTGKTSFTFLPSVTEVCDHAFSDNETLTTVVFPAKLKRIGRDAFFNCKVENFSFPDTLEEIDVDAFAGTPWFSAQADGLVYAGTVAYRWKGSEIPETVTLKAGTLGVAGAAFFQQTALKNVIFPTSVKYIGKSAFSNCSSLASLRLPKNLRCIEANAFSECTSLKRVTLPDSVTTIGEGCFLKCASLTTLTLSQNLTEIPRWAFGYCSSLTGDIVLPKTVAKVGWHAFDSTYNLNSITVLNPDAQLTESLDSQGSTIIFPGLYSGIKRPLYGFKGSTAEVYADNYNWRFVAITEIKGDVNFDGKVNVRDVTDIQRVNAELMTFSPQAKANADANGDGKISIDDVTNLQRYLAEMTDSL